MSAVVSLKKPPPGQRSSYPKPLAAMHTAVPGRARFRVYSLYRSEKMKSRLESRLVKLDGIRSAQANILTGSLLIHFNPSTPLAKIEALIASELADVPLARSALKVQAGLAGTLLTALQALKPKEHGVETDTLSASDAQTTQTPWHSLDQQALFAALASTAAGLASAAANARLARYGRNALPAPQPRSELSLFFAQLANPPMAMLGISAVVSVLTGGIVDAGVIAAVALINAAIGFVTERQSERTIASLNPTTSNKTAVVRDGAVHEIDKHTLVPGDIVVLTPGSFVAADARLLETERLSLDEAPLTGESMPVEKRADAVYPANTPLADRHNMVYMGTVVTGGSGHGIVVATGLQTELGKIQALAASAATPETPMERQLDEMGAQLAWLSSGICAVVFGIGLLRGYGLLAMLKTAISLAVAAVPEGLPTVATTTLALGVRDMRRRNVLVRRLDAVETLGSIQFFCFDKTGTLTQNRMTVMTVYAGKQRIQVQGKRFVVAGQPIDPLQATELKRLCEAVALCSEVELDDTAQNHFLNGSATEKALIELALQAGIDVGSLQRSHPRLSLQHRAADRPYMVSVHQDNETGEPLTAIKGSPEQVLALCRHYLNKGKLLRLDGAARRMILRENERMAGQALRVLGVAYATANEVQPNNLVWLGLAGIADPIRPGIDTLLWDLHRAGISTAMITGDQSATAYAIAKQLDLAAGHPLEVLDSGSLDKTDPELLSGVVQRVQVFARVSPAHKLQIVQALQRAGKVVAMTGDGINDGPALKAADLGVAMGKEGTEVARSLADIVLEDDNLQTMEVAVRDGRTIYGNVRKAIRFLLSTNLSEIEVMLAAIGLGLGQPLNPMQLLWINLITDIFPGLALAMEQPEADIMERPPRDPQEPIVKRDDLSRLALESSVLSTGTLASYGYAYLRYGSGPQAGTQAFMTLTLAQLLHSLSCRSEQHTILEHGNLPPNPYLNGALGVSLVAQILAVLLPGLRKILGATPMTLLDALVMGAGAALPLLINEMTKKAASQDLPSPDSGLEKR